MKTSLTFTFLFWVNKSRIIDGKAELFERATVDGRRTNLGLKRKIEIKRWDTKAKKASGTFTELIKINNHIESVRVRLYEIYQELKYKNQFITAQLIKARYNGKDDNSKTLQEILIYHKIKN